MTATTLRRVAAYGGLLTLLVLGALLVWHGATGTTAEAAPLPVVTFGPPPGPPGDAAEPSGASTSDWTAPAAPAAEVRAAVARAKAGTYAANRIVLPSLGIDAPIVDEPAHAGELVIPGDPTTVGRWADSAATTAPTGTTLLAGHVSVADVGQGALYRLHEVTQGTVVVTTDTHGRPRVWTVSGLTVTPKDAFPRLAVGGARRLVVVTCGGPLVDTPRGHTFEDNVIVTAVPAP